jgi:hypothetical protein
MSESPYVQDSEYTVNPSFYESNSRQYLVNCINYILSIDTYSIVNDVVLNGELISTSTVPHGEYELTIDTYVYEPPISRYPSWTFTFGQCLWTILKVAGIVVGCITFFQMVAEVGIIGVIKTFSAGIQDIAGMGWDLLTGRMTVEIFPRIQQLWPDAYNSVITLITQGEHAGHMPCWTYVYENGKLVRNLRWYLLN